MSRSSRRSLLLLPLCGLVLGLLTHCGNPAGPAPVPCAESTVFKGGAQVAAGTSSVQSITTTATGALDVSVDWALDTSVMNLVIAQAPCTIDQLHAAACNVLFSGWSPPKPLTDRTSLLPAGGYVVLVGNPNAAPELISTKVVLRSAGCPVP
jgi:hypothetical protein